MVPPIAELEPTRRLPDAIVRWLRIVTTAATVAAMLGRPSAAAADPILSLALEPAPAGDRGIAIEHAAVRGEHLLSVRFLVGISRRPLTATNRFGETDTIVDNQLWFHSLATYTLANRLAVHVDLPILLDQSEGDRPKSGVPAAPGPDGPTAFGDLRFGLRLGLFNAASRARRGFDLAVGTTVWLPTGNDKYTSDGAVRGAAGLLMDGDGSGLYWAANVGVKARPPVKLGSAPPLMSGSALALGAAAGVFLDHGHALSVGPELTVESTFVGSNLFNASQTLVHLLFGAHYLPYDGPLEVGVAAGPDLAHGPGSADYQVVIFCGMVPERALLAPRDRDHDGIPDPDDACPSTPGIRSDDPEMNGCPPRRDTDSDGIVDNDDACPTVFGPPSPDPKMNGCPPFPDVDNGPPPTAPKAELGAEQIVISQQVVFETGSDVLLPESSEILKEVARLLTEHPEVELLEVQGHTDERGTADYNRKLSRDRAMSVVTWLVQQGIGRTRLQARGYGRDRPIADNSTEEGMQKNRRVEFHVMRTTAPAKPQ